MRKPGKGGGKKTRKRQNYVVNCSYFTPRCPTQGSKNKPGKGGGKKTSETAEYHGVGPLEKTREGGGNSDRGSAQFRSRRELASSRITS